jgi:hypothetical protein
MIVFALVVVVMLVVCLELQEGAVSRALNTPSLIDFLKSLRH